MWIIEEIAEQLNISAKEVQRRICAGETLAHFYLQWKYNWDSKNDKQVPF